MRSSARRYQRVLIISIFLQLLVFSLAAVPAQSAPSPAGSLDSSFGTGGKVVTDVGTYDAPAAVAVLPGGKVVVAGSADGDFALARYNVDGSLDPSFGTGGKVVTAIGPGDDFASAVAIQAGGRIVVAGASVNGGSFDFAVVRYNADGSLDASFGTGGKVVTAIGPGDDFGTGVAIQAGGAIVVAGFSFNGSSLDFAVVRYRTDGSLDSGFGTSGVVTTDFGGDELGTAVAVEATGRIVVAGSSFNDPHFLLAGYNRDGSLDSSFGIGGRVTTTAIGDPGGDYAWAMAVQPDGRIVVAGEAYGTGSDFALARYNRDGSLDTGFGAGGKVTTDFSVSSDAGFAVVIQPGGRIVVAGFTTVRRPQDSGFDWNFALARYNSDGTLDAGFGTEGTVTTPIGAWGFEFGRAIALYPGGRLVVAGDTYAGPGVSDFAVVRYDAGPGNGGPSVAGPGNGPAPNARALPGRPEDLTAPGRRLGPGTDLSRFSAARS